LGGGWIKPFFWKTKRFFHSFEDTLFFFILLDPTSAAAVSDRSMVEVVVAGSVCARGSCLISESAITMITTGLIS